MWELVCDLLTEPEQLQRDLEKMIEQEQRGERGDPDREAKVWLQKISEVGRMRGNYQEMAARGLITLRDCPKSLGSTPSVALQTTVKALLDPFRPPHNVRIRLRSLPRTPFRTVS